MDFAGAAPSGGEPAIIWLSGDDKGREESMSTSSIQDVLSPSEDEILEIEIMARCAERQMADPIPIPKTNSNSDKAKVGTPRPTTFTGHTTERYFEHGNGNGPIRRSQDVGTNHSIYMCRDLIPMVDTPMSPPEEDRWPI